MHNMVMALQVSMWIMFIFAMVMPWRMNQAKDTAGAPIPEKWDHGPMPGFYVVLTGNSAAGNTFVWFIVGGILSLICPWWCVSQLLSYGKLDANSWADATYVKTRQLWCTAFAVLEFGGWLAWLVGVFAGPALPDDQRISPWWLGVMAFIAFLQCWNLRYVAGWSCAPSDDPENDKGILEKAYG